MPEYTFMSDQEKRKYFAKKYSTYQEKLGKEKAVLKHSHSKKVKFTNNVEIKSIFSAYIGFNDVDMPAQVKHSKPIIAKHSIVSTRTM